MTNNVSPLMNPRRHLSRRSFFQGSVGAGAVLASTLAVPARADEDDRKAECALALPIPQLTGPGHFFFPGPVDGSAAPTDPTGAHANGRDPSTVTNFEGFIGSADLVFSGIGTDTTTGATAAYSFHTDSRFMKGVFVGSDQKRHRGAFAFL